MNVIRNHFSARSLVVFATLICPLLLTAQITADFETEMNTNCAGSECDYEGPGILINEIMMSPNTGDGSLWGGSSTQGGEWIELYNPNFCDPVDVSCYYLGNNANDPFPYPGGYVIPTGTVVPPAGFLLIRGINAAPVPSELLVENGGNTIELVVTGEGVCVGDGTRLWFPNAGGWFGFYDSNGIPQDAVSWANQSNTEQVPCTPTLPGCSFEDLLLDYNNFPDDRKEYILNVSAATYQGQSLRRMPDGGEWDGPGVPTYAICNDICVDPGTSTCNGSATVTPSGGVPPYQFLWNDAQEQTTATAVGLCGGEYCVTITDSENMVEVACVIIEEPSYATESSDVLCDGEVYTLPDNTTVTEGGTYEVMLTTAGGCDSLVTLELEAFPSYDFELSASICENSSYTLPDGTEVNEAGTYTLEYTTVNGCDSVYVVNLSVDPVINVSQTPEICQGESWVLPDGNEVTEGGIYEVLMPGAECDTLFTVDLTVNPTYLISSEETICEGESFQLPDGSIVDETGIYTLTYNTVAGCDSVLEVLLTVAPLPVINIPLADAYCFGAGIIPVNATPPGGTLSGFFTDGSELNLTAAPPGNYSVQYAFTDENGCSNTGTHNYSVASIVDPMFSWSSGCFNVAEFTNLTTDPENQNTYLWLVEDEEIATTPNASWAYSEAGTYEVTLIATNEAGCDYSVSQQIDLEIGFELAEYSLPNVITPNGDQLNDVFRLIPEDDECLTYTITFFNRWGKKVYEMSAVGEPFSGIDVSGNELSEGVYYYMLESPQIDCENAAFERLCNGSVHVLR